jgi:hypothetical protein
MFIELRDIKAKNKSLKFELTEAGKYAGVVIDNSILVVTLSDAQLKELTEFLMKATGVK